MSFLENWRTLFTPKPETEQEVRGSWWTDDGRLNPSAVIQETKRIRERIGNSQTSISDVIPRFTALRADVLREYRQAEQERLGILTSIIPPMDAPGTAHVEDKIQSLKNSLKDIAEIEQLLKKRAGVNFFPMP